MEKGEGRASEPECSGGGSRKASRRRERERERESKKKTREKKKKSRDVESEVGKKEREKEIGEKREGGWREVDTSCRTDAATVGLIKLREPGRSFVGFVSRR